MVQAVNIVVETVGLSEPKQGWDLLFSRGIVKFLTHWVVVVGAGEEVCRAGDDAEVTNSKMWGLLEVALDLPL